MGLKIKIILLAVVPLVVSTVIIIYLNQKSARDLAADELSIYEFNLVNAKKEALRSHVEIAMSAIRPILEDDSLGDMEAQEIVKSILKGLRYSDDGYFFVYDSNGVNLVHPTQPELVGENLWLFKDTSGNYLIQHLMAVAKTGGGFHRYIWEKPPLMEQEEKIGYAIMIDRWHWMLGTGLYLGDVYQELAKAKATMNANIRRSFFLVSVVASITLICVILLGLAINLHEHKLADSRLKALVQRFMRLQVLEKRRLSRELHDGINQMLVSCKFRIELAGNKLQRDDDKAVVKEELIKAEGLINQTINDIRQVSHDLRPTVLDDLGLETGLKGLIDQFQERTRIKVKYSFKVIDELPDEIEIALYRFAQEALTNIEKHSQAKNVILQVWQSQQRVIFECLDDGRGCSHQSTLSPGIGLINMRERIELVGGDFVFQSQKEKGTKVSAILSITSPIMD
ncbi:cache domain-containing protein [Marinomonas pollencensis]|uniref:histidine kinase n=1 Tax=Marinomonas pollencensis TaxID=491954 RepID=A0A3E0DPF2_9GAMM|nr:cache domain-containing protein [Marinomonas pollencensis]REG83725.1 two-component system NarL family sensor kinase [Marinomonas pollencensis]